jgi:hypothetical protein
MRGSIAKGLLIALVFAVISISTYSTSAAGPQTPSCGDYKVSTNEVIVGIKFPKGSYQINAFGISCTKVMGSKGIFAQFLKLKDKDPLPKSWRYLVDAVGAPKFTSGTGVGFRVQKITIPTPTSTNSPAGNSGLQDGALCDENGPKNGRSSTGLELECQKGGDGKYAWHPPTPSPSSTNSSVNSCTKKPEFTYNFIDPKYVQVVTPIGGQTAFGGVIAVRSYVFPSQEFLGQELPIFAPTDMSLSQASYYKPAGSSSTYKPEYSLYFDAGCGITVKFFHIKGVVGKTADAVPAEPSTSSAGQPVKVTSVKAGEQIGWYKLGETSVAFDFWVDDAAVTNEFIVNSHFVDSNALHSVCPYNYYSADKKAIWLAKLGGSGGPVPGTSCGVISQGVIGTADGMWFISESTKTDQLLYDGAYQSQISFVVDPSGILRIGGLNASGTLKQMMVPKTKTTKWPWEVFIGITYCWSDSEQSVKVNVINEKTMAVLVGAGSCDALGIPASGRTYYR